VAHKENDPKPILDLTLFELIAIAKAVRWLPANLQYGRDDWDAKKAKIGDFTEVAREIRNLLHPGRYARDHHKKRITPKIVDMILHIADEVADSLSARLP
jgi:hypothetical protein